MYNSNPKNSNLLEGSTELLAGSNFIVLLTMCKESIWVRMFQVLYNGIQILRLADLKCFVSQQPCFEYNATLNWQQIWIIRNRLMSSCLGCMVTTEIWDYWSLCYNFCYSIVQRIILYNKLLRRAFARRIRANLRWFVRKLQIVPFT